MLAVPTSHHMTCRMGWSRVKLNLAKNWIVLLAVTKKKRDALGEHGRLILLAFIYLSLIYSSFDPISETFCRLRHPSSRSCTAVFPEFCKSRLRLTERKDWRFSSQYFYSYNDNETRLVVRPCNSLFRGTW
ncbi:hypothetical protein E2C01_072072 [Portunus trituberculatus]|uniref:Uncharacterized protein n=1 Tax=Portunus trituberculatus TaxID=210409 RepID=A0A5B7IA60_PORTR|nr:hypothetical protein [Portunus trituberculatus]